MTKYFLLALLWLPVVFGVSYGISRLAPKTESTYFGGIIKSKNGAGTKLGPVVKATKNKILATKSKDGVTYYAYEGKEKINDGSIRISSNARLISNKKEVIKDKKGNDEEIERQVMEFTIAETFIASDGKEHWVEISTTTDAEMNLFMSPPPLELMRNFFIGSPALAATSQFFTISGDGSQRMFFCGSWANARAGSGCLTDLGETLHGENQGGQYHLGRMWFDINTSALPDNATIVAATTTCQARYVGYDDSEATNKANLVLVNNTRVSNTVLSTSDWSTIGGTKLSEKVYGVAEYGVMTTGTPINFPLNSTGLTFVSTTGYTKLGIRPENDLNNTTPSARSYTPAPASTNTGNGAEQKCRILVEYTLPGASGSLPKSQIIYFE